MDSQYVVDNSERCLQTLRGHGQTVIDVSFNKNIAVIASCSTDKTIRLFKDDSDKNFIVDPNFKLIMTFDFTLRYKNVQQDIHSNWFTCFTFLESDAN